MVRGEESLVCIIHGSRRGNACGSRTEARGPSSLSRLRLNQIQCVNVKRRCQRITTVIAHRDVPFKDGGRPKENGHAEVLFSFVKLRGVFPR